MLITSISKVAVTTVATATLVLAAAGSRANGLDFEVWAIDQANTADGGNKIYIYDGNAMIKQRCGNSPTHIIDLSTFGVSERPHMLLFNEEQTHAIVANVAHLPVGEPELYFIDARTRLLAGALEIDAHAAIPTPDSRYVVSVDPGEQLMHLISTDYETNTYTIVDVIDTSVFAAQTGGSAAGVICPVVTADSRFVYATFNGGGLAVFEIDESASPTLTPRDLYTAAEVAPVGCGGIQVGYRMHINTATAAPAVADHVYVFDTRKIGSKPAPVVIPLTAVNDGHGMTASRNGLYVWNWNRDSNNISVIRSKTSTVSNTIDIGRLPDGTPVDLAPDLADTSPDDKWAFVSLRGPVPLTANNPAFDNAVGERPGVGLVKIKGGKRGNLECIASISAGTYAPGTLVQGRDVGGLETADIHGLRVRQILD